jgi:hypothetical protein
LFKITARVQRAVPSEDGDVLLLVQDSGAALAWLHVSGAFDHWLAAEGAMVSVTGYRVSQIQLLTPPLKKLLASLSPSLPSSRIVTLLPSATATVNLATEADTPGAPLTPFVGPYPRHLLAQLAQPSTHERVSVLVRVLYDTVFACGTGPRRLLVFDGSTSAPVALYVLPGTALAVNMPLTPPDGSAVCLLHGLRVCDATLDAMTGVLPFVSPLPLDARRLLAQPCVFPPVTMAATAGSHGLVLVHGRIAGVAECLGLGLFCPHCDSPAPPAALSSAPSGCLNCGQTTDAPVAGGTLTLLVAPPPAMPGVDLRVVLMPSTVQALVDVRDIAAGGVDGALLVGRNFGPAVCHVLLVEPADQHGRPCILLDETAIAPLG